RIGVDGIGILVEVLVDIAVKVFVDVVVVILAGIAVVVPVDIAVESRETGKLIGSFGFVLGQLVHQALAARRHPLAALLTGQAHGPADRPLVLGQTRRRQIGVGV